jgi:hypothetical protein
MLRGDADHTTIAIIAADRRQARSIFRFIQGLMENTKSFKPLIEAERWQPMGVPSFAVWSGDFEKAARVDAQRRSLLSKPV